MAVKRTCMALDLARDSQLVAEYLDLHSTSGMWPEIPAGIREAGIADMQIYRIGYRLFMIVDHDEDTSLTDAFAKMSTMPRQPEWAALMAGFQRKLADAKPDEHWATMEPVFLLNDHIR
ncbi:L-rhamnose mutarotase [Dyadobacter sandarakinus]|uniref:L-rhamnose mutarotase n=1 Tax=Dyadobacter sandarakinus TaxID=2747268 RepID=A0ABX7I5C3_9BACT|nr:L-rhamnose mutarotase [Dyadobacter sandarakinus]QRR00687.1 L-rhamnose mutarotase [Dyadobacter sandarakinus]